MKDYYHILEIDNEATISEIKAAFRRLAHRYHPDKNPGDEDAAFRFIEINEAYNILSDKALRDRYDFRKAYGYDPGYQIEEVATHRPRRPPPPEFYRKHYKKEKTEYTRGAYFWGAFSVLAIVLSVSYFSVYMLRESSERDFQKGVSYYRLGDYYTAVAMLRRSVRDLSQYNDLALILSGKIIAEEWNDYTMALEYLDKAQYYSSSDSIISEIYYLKGYCYNQLGESKSALDNYRHVQGIWPKVDSAIYQISILQLMKFNEPEKALQGFNELIQRNANFNAARLYKALILQKNDNHQEALLQFGELIARNYQKGIIHFHMAVSEIRLENKPQACDHLREAIKLNVNQANILWGKYCLNPDK
ncbi:MAG: DnaJ domain-containing protein [Cyclobacteriaceae bacterium]